MQLRKVELNAKHGKRMTNWGKDLDEMKLWIADARIGRREKVDEEFDLILGRNFFLGNRRTSVDIRE